MDLAAINAFVSVGDKGGFRAAATALGITSAGVSKAVSRLETQLGVTLVARTTRSVRLTAAGAVYHARCKTILADLHQAGQEAVEGSASPQGKLVISASRVFGRMRVLPVIADYVKQYPQVEVEVRLSDRVVNLVDEGVDVAIRIGHLPDSSSAGLIMVNDYLVEPFLEDGSLVRVLREFEMPPVPISVVHLPTRNPSSAARAFIGMLRRRSIDKQ